MLNIVASYHYMQLQETNEPNLRKWGKKLILGPILAQTLAYKTFLWVLSQLDVRLCCKLLLYAISRKNNETKLRKQQKT